MSAPDPTPAPDSAERIAKVMARRGVASRRAAEQLIAEGRVTLDGKVVETPATKVAPDAAIAVDGTPVAAAERPRLWRYHKPTGLVTSHRDEKGRATIFANLPARLPRVVSVGRLDLNSEGLLLLTNDGGLARLLELPATGWTRRYRVRAYGTASEAALAKLKLGLVLDGVRYGPVTAVLETRQGSNAWYVVSLKEGKNREVRKVMEAIGLTVNRLIRTSYGPFQLGSLAPGAVDEVGPKVLREQLGQLYPPLAQGQR